MPLYEISPDGWFVQIGGRPVNHRDLTQRLPGSAMPWAAGRPVGVLWHYTSGFQGDISGSMIANGFITAQLSVGRDGSVYQYSDIWTAHWHAFAASQWGIGVEHEEHPPDTALTELQLQTSAQVFAAVILAVKDHFGNEIPRIHIPGCDLMRSGLKEHADGVGCTWDPKGHTDALNGWGWPKYIAAIEQAMASAGGDALSDLTSDQQKFLQGMIRRVNRQGAPDPSADPQVKAGFAALDTVIDEAMASPKPPVTSGVPKSVFDRHFHEQGSKTGPPKISTA